MQSTMFDYHNLMTTNCNSTSVRFD
uniref:Uncharacterized protein n=1 Tax=Arundo donax TaxID=35708 RepID=A0A0A9HFQ2_ARUDO